MAWTRGAQRDIASLGRYRNEDAERGCARIVVSAVDADIGWIVATRRRYWVRKQGIPQTTVELLCKHTHSVYSVLTEQLSRSPHQNYQAIP
jgi:hypothetical protein